MKTKKHYLIVGGTSGLGYEYVKKIHKNNVVSVIGRNINKISELNKKGVKAINFDLSNLIDIEKQLSEIISYNGKIDNFIFCAGIQNIKPMKMLTVEEIEKIITINFTSAAVLTSLCSKNKFSNELANFILISSTAASNPERGIATYAATKAALNQLIKSLSTELAPKRINGIAPGWLKTPMTANFKHIYNEEFVNKYNKKALGITSLDDVCNVIDYLLSGQSKYINGEIIHVDGGARFC